MPYPELALGLLVLLATPGPTNTLMALAGGQAGGRGIRALMLAEVAAYLVITVPLALAGMALFDAVPSLRHVVAGAAAGWVLWLAVRMWRLPAPGRGRGYIRPIDVFVTTLLNPKALLIGLVLLPAPTPLWPRVALLVGMILVCALGWALLGSLAARRGGASWVLPRVASCWLAVLSIVLATSAIRA